MQQEPSTTPTKPKKRALGKDKPRRKRRRGGLLNLLLFIGIIGAVALFFWAEQQRRDAESKLQETQQQLEEIKESTQQSGQQVADEVLSKVRSHMQIPDDPQPTVATIIDVQRLRETSDFYNNAENGDHLILTETRAILYDPNEDQIIDVVPVILNPEDIPQQEGGGTEDDANTDEQAEPGTQPGQGAGTNSQPGAGGTETETTAPAGGAQPGNLTPAAGQ